MEVRAGDSVCCNRSSSSSSFSQVLEGSVGGRASGEVETEAAGVNGGNVSRLIPRLISGAVSGALTGLFAFAGAITGAVSGALASRATESGFLRGAGLGAVAGAVLSVEVLKASRACWYTDRFGYQNPFSLADFIEELVNGQFVRDQFSPAMFTAYRWQITITDVGHDENYDIFGEISPRGLSSASLMKLSRHVIREDSNSCGKNSVCSICLQEMEAGDTARSLPHCSHTFHLMCIDKWLIRHPSCPICRDKI